MSKSNAVILILCALALAGCASEAASPGPSAAAPRPIVLAPSDDAYQAAILSLSPEEQKILNKGLGFTLDTLLAAPTPIVSMAWSRKRADTPSFVNISDFVRYLDLKPALGGGVRVNVMTAKVLAGLTYDTATFDPVFRIQAEIEPSNAGVTTVSGLGSGPQCRRPGDEFPADSPRLIQSEEVAFMKALLKTLLKISEQVQQS